VRTVGDGPSALAAGADFEPDVAVLDIGMPGMTGYDVATRLRASAPSLLLLALSGLGQETDRARAAEAGFHHHFTKPVDPHALVQYLASQR